MQLTGSVFLITGGSSGLGAACVQSFLDGGARVVIADRQPPSRSIQTSDVEFVPADVTSTADIQRALQVARERFGGLQGAINCAGVLGAAKVLSRRGPLELEDFSRVIDVNLIGTFNVVRLAAADLSQNTPDAGGERGVIVNTSSIAAWEGQVGQAAYAASKGAVAAMTLPLAREFARYGIRVVAVAPGIFDTPMIDSLPEAARQALQEQLAFPPRPGSPPEFAALVRHIVENPMLNGATLRLDGAVRLA